MLLAVSVALMAAFIAIELRHERPLLRLGILRNSHLVHANMAGFAISGGYAAFQFIATLYVQDALGCAQATAGVAGEEQGLASGLVNTSLQVGTVAMIAVVSAVLGSSAPIHDQLLPGMRNAASVIVGVLAGASLLTAAFLLWRRGRATPADDAAVSPEVGVSYPIPVSSSGSRPRRRRGGARRVGRMRAGR
ncbi:hypothetical protein [Microtetraspora malaysiensis]|uniref:hypothetical protein n=1 Tax=Microtetraspora malaysiensis TaxID=161358 RepID=UPI00082D8BC3|nr:hypothetical protein [Microtetraspora malaysiensis]